MHSEDLRLSGFKWRENKKPEEKVSERHEES